ncbi:uncharacterized protein LOC144647866 [Oculina patagonica]
MWTGGYWWRKCVTRHVMLQYRNVFHNLVPRVHVPLDQRSENEGLWDRVFSVTGFLSFRLNCASVRYRVSLFWAADFKARFGKSLIYQVLPAIFDFIQCGCEPTKEESVVIVVSPLNALMQDQVEKLQQKLNVCVLQSAEDDAESQNIKIPKNLQQCSIVFGHPEVFVDDRNVTKILRSKEFQRRVKAIVVDEAHLVHQWSNFRPAYGKIGYLSNILPTVPVLALTGTATTATKSHIIDILGLSSPVTIESNPDRPNIFYASHVRPDRGEDKLEPILKPIVQELKLKKKEMPLTLIYASLETIADSFLYFASHMGKDQYYPSSAEHCAKNRLFTQYHAQYPEHERKRIVDELVNGTSNHRVLFVTVAFGIGIDCNNIRRIIHIGVPYTMEEYCQEVGRAGRDGLPARADIYYNSYDISKSRKSMTDIMKTYVQSKDCKRKMILNYFDHDVPSNQPLDHTCCDFHKAHCTCENCELASAAARFEALCQQQTCFTEENEGNPQSISFTPGAKENIRQNLEQYRMKLQRDLGRSTVGSTGLCSGFPIKLITMILQHLTELTSVEKVEAILPVYSKEIAKDIFCIIQKQITGEGGLPSEREGGT